MLRPPVQELMKSGVDWIHLDIMDGQFVPPITFGSDLVRQLRLLGSTKFEAHLMTLTPEKHFDSFREAGCQRITFQVEATSHAHRLVQSLHDAGVQAGVAINPGTPVEAVFSLLEIADLVLVMTVNPGWGGQDLIASCLEKVAAIRRRAPGLSIEVDGGIDPETLSLAAQAGASVFVAGSYLTKRNSISEAITELRNACVSSSSPPLV